MPTSQPARPQPSRCGATTASNAGFSIALRAALACAALASAAGTLHAQCGWSPVGDVSVAGLTQRVAKLTTWDPDGSGPILPRVVAAGNISLGGTTPLAGVAWWDAQTSSWQSLQPAGSGDNTALTCVPGELCFSSISSLFTINNTLVAAGLFQVGRQPNITTDELNIAYWTGTQWRAVGTGAPDVSRGLPFGVQAAGGTGSTIVASCTDGLYVLSGSLESGTWQRLNISIDNLFATEILPFGSDILRIRRPGSALNEDTPVERFTGLGWEALTPPSTGLEPVDALVDANGDLFVAFVAQLGSQLTIVRKWENGEFVDVGSAMEGSARQLALHQGSLYAAGNIFETAGGSTRGIARFADGDWQPVGPNTLSEERPGFGANSQVQAIASSGPLLFVGGEFLEAGPLQVANIAAFNGTAWQATPSGGSNGPLGTLEVDADGTLLVSGRFTRVGGISANRIARVNPLTNAWSALGQGLTTVPADIESWQSSEGLRIIAATVPMQSWDGSQWQEFGSPLVNNPLDEGINRLQEFGGDLFVLGRRMRTFAASFRWDGTDWAFFVPNDPFDSIFSLAQFGDTVFAAGSFPVGLFVSNAGVNKLSEENAWAEQDLDKPPFLVTQLINYNNLLVAVGAISRPGNPTNVEAWDGFAWSPLGGGVDNSVSAAVVYNNDLVVGGRFTRAGTAQATNLARWNGTSWSAFPTELRTVSVGTAVDGIASLAVVGGSLYVSGSFGDPALGLGIARWTDCVVACDTIDFNNDTLFPADDDLVDFLSVLAGGNCSTGTCNDIDFNNDGLFPSDDDLIAFLRVLAGGNC